jgi:hypothetical protein
MVVVREYFSSSREENSSSTCFKYYWRSPTTRPSTRHCCTGYAWQSSWASSDYSSMATPYWWFHKSTRSGTSTRTPWTPTSRKYASSRKCSRGWKFTMWFATTMWARTCSPNGVLIELTSHHEFLFMSCITLPSGHQTQVPSLRVPRNPIERS